MTLKLIEFASHLVALVRAGARSGCGTLVEGSELLDALDSIESAELTIVSTGTANLPALALYRRRGFEPVGERHIAPGVTVTLLERKNSSASRPIHSS